VIVAAEAWKQNEADSRRQLDTIAGCSGNLAMEEVFSAKVTTP
jgi:hypothetical protein